MAVKKGNMLRAIREKLENSLEAKASDSRFPSYLFETKGEIVDIKGDYALVKFGQVPQLMFRARVTKRQCLILRNSCYCDVTGHNNRKVINVILLRSVEQVGLESTTTEG